MKVSKAIAVGTTSFNTTRFFTRVFLDCHQGKDEIKRQEGPLVRLRRRQTRDQTSRRHQSNPEGVGFVHTLASVLGAIRPAGLSMDFPSEANGRIHRFLHDSSRPDAGKRSKPVYANRTKDTDLFNKVVNPLLILAFIPLFQTVVYPLLEKCNLLKKPLQRLVCGGVLAAVSFIVSACIWLAIEAKNPVLPSPGNGQIRIYNTLPCTVMVTSEVDPNGTFSIPSGDYYKNIDLELSGNKSFQYSLTGSCSSSEGTFNVYDGESVGYFFNASSSVFFLDDVSVEEDGLPRIRCLAQLDDPQR